MSDFELHGEIVDLSARTTESCPVRLAEIRYDWLDQRYVIIDDTGKPIDSMQCAETHICGGSCGFSRWVVEWADKWAVRLGGKAEWM